MKCGSKVMKWLVFFFNFLFFVTGLALVIFGAYTLASAEFDVFPQIVQGDTDSVKMYGIGSLVIGVFVLIMGFLGCCGACRENQCMLITFAVIVVLLFVAEIAMGILVFVKKDDIMNKLTEDGKVKDALKKQLIEDYKNDKEYAKELFDEVQKEKQCCGFDGTSDWTKVPETCCKEPDCDAGPYFEDGCGKHIIDKTVVKYAFMVGIALIVVAVFQLFAIIFSCCLALAIKKERAEGGTV